MPMNDNFKGKGYRPIYQQIEEVKKVVIGAAQPLKKPGKIYNLEPYIFINEQGLGIHIIDNRNPRKPINLSFVSIFGNYDMAAKGNYLYADNLSDMVVLDISDPVKPKVINRISDVIPTRDFPPFSNVYFECVEKSKGVVIDWEYVSMERPKCYR